MKTLKNRLKAIDDRLNPSAGKYPKCGGKLLRTLLSEAEAKVLLALRKVLLP